MFLGEPLVPRVFTLTGGRVVGEADGTTMEERPCCHGVTQVLAVFFLDLIKKNPNNKKT